MMAYARIQEDVQHYAGKKPENLPDAKAGVSGSLEAEAARFRLLERWCLTKQAAAAPPQA
jgi:hypothetical protein